MDKLKKRFPFYSKLINLYPNRYRKEFGQQILQTTADMLDNSGSKFTKVLVWLKISVDLPINVTKQQLHYAGADYIKNSPSYLKLSGLISGILLVPFILALTANALDKVINNHTLYHSWLWSKPFGKLWIIDFPLSAFLLAVGSFVYYLIAYPKKPFLKKAFDYKKYWPVIITAFAAFGILFILVFHDSAQCWVHTPNYYAKHARQIWQCTTQNRAFI